MGRLLVSGADGNVARRLVNALAASGDPWRGGDIRHPMRERSPAHLMSHATPGPHDFPVRPVVGSETYADRPIERRGGSIGGATTLPAEHH